MIKIEEIYEPPWADKLYKVTVKLLVSDINDLKAEIQKIYDNKSSLYTSDMLIDSGNRINLLSARLEQAEHILHRYVMNAQLINSEK